MDSKIICVNNVSKKMSRINQEKQLVEICGYLHPAQEVSEEPAYKGPLEWMREGIYRDARS